MTRRHDLRKKPNVRGTKSTNDSERFNDMDSKPNPTSNFAEIHAPESMSLTYNTDQVIEFTNLILWYYDRKQHLDINFSYVKIFDYESIALLLGVLVKFRVANLSLRGSFPYDRKAKEFLRHSIFYKYLFDKSAIKESERYNFFTSFVDENFEVNQVQKAAKGVDSAMTGFLISKASKTVWGQSHNCPGVQAVCLELMQNTDNHAAIEKERVHHFWISLNHRVREKIVKFVFMDFGVGIFDSIQNKIKQNKLFFESLSASKAFTLSNNALLLKEIMEGQIHSYVPTEFFRGNGLPFINDTLKRNEISKLRIISNNVRSSVYKDKYELLRNSFSGTIVTWELDINNIHASL